MRNETDTTPTEPSTTDCPHGDTHCPGPNPEAWDFAETAPCFRCYTDGQCPSGNTHCAERGNASDDDRKCWDCLLRHAMEKAKRKAKQKAGSRPRDPEAIWRRERRKRRKQQEKDAARREERRLGLR